MFDLFLRVFHLFDDMHAFTILMFSGMALSEAENSIAQAGENVNLKAADIRQGVHPSAASPSSPSCLAWLNFTACFDIFRYCPHPLVKFALCFLF